MYSPKLNFVILMISVIWIKQSVCKSNRYSQVSYIDSAIRNFLKDEENLWNTIHSRSNLHESQNATLNDIFNSYKMNYPEPYIGNIAFVRTINFELARHSENIDYTYKEANQRLNDSMITQEFCEDVVRNTRNELSQIFEITKSATFMNYLRDNSDFCKTRGRIVSPGGESMHLQNVIMDFYIVVPEALYKGYKTVQMCYMFLAVKTPNSINQPTLTNTRSHKTKSYEVRNWFQSQHQSLNDNVFSIARNFSGEIWSCDDFNNNSSYTEITNFVQGYIENEVNFNRDGSCSSTCSDYRIAEQHGCANSTMCHINYLDKNKTRCDGQIRSCQFIESDMTLCPNENDMISNRRYNYVQYSSGLTFGRKTFCPEKFKLKSWTRWFVSCDFCFCYCDIDENNEYRSDRYFSLRPVLTDLTKNKVITGLRLMKSDSIIHIFAAERQLGLNGHINLTESKDQNVWISDYNFVIKDTGVKEGEQYHKLTWRDRAIELDTIRAPKGEVVTGARFRVDKKRLRFEIRTTEFNYETGYLLRETSKSVWRGNNHPYKEPIPINEADVPTLSPHKSKRHREDNKYVEFTPTDIYKDMAQTTVPFIDTQEVEAIIPKPLSGAGIYYKSSPGYGGFIAPLIVLYDVDNESN